jgi:hypothetical protein
MASESGQLYASPRFFIWLSYPVCALVCAPVSVIGCLIDRGGVSQSLICSFWFLLVFILGVTKSRQFTFWAYTEPIGPVNLMIGRGKNISFGGPNLLFCVKRLFCRVIGIL